MVGVTSMFPGLIGGVVKQQFGVVLTLQGQIADRIGKAVFSGRTQEMKKDKEF